MNNQKEYKKLMLDYLDKLFEDIEDEYISEYAKKASRLEIYKRIDKITKG